jgi:hypothetical protein
MYQTFHITGLIKVNILLRLSLLRYNFFKAWTWWWTHKSDISTFLCQSSSHVWTLFHYGFILLHFPVGDSNYLYHFNYVCSCLCLCFVIIFKGTRDTLLYCLFWLWELLPLFFPFFFCIKKKDFRMQRYLGVPFLIHVLDLLTLQSCSLSLNWGLNL